MAEQTAQIYNLIDNNLKIKHTHTHKYFTQNFILK